MLEVHNVIFLLSLPDAVSSIGHSEPSVPRKILGVRLENVCPFSLGIFRKKT
jgi:hypothetical protein